MKNAMRLIFLTALAANLVLLNSCKKEAEIPILTTTTISGITSTSATSGGNVTSNGGLEVTVSGICWSTSPNPDINDSITTDGTGLGTFISIINGLTPNTTYLTKKLFGDL